MTSRKRVEPKLFGDKPARKRGERWQTLGPYRCSGVNGCGAILDKGLESAQRHADAHGGARLAVVLANERDNLRALTTEPEGETE